MDTIVDKTSLKIKVEKITGLANDKFSTAVFTKRVTLDGTVGTFVSLIFTKQGEGTRQNLGSDIFEVTAKKLEEDEGGVLEKLKKGRERALNLTSDAGVEISFANCLFYKNACYIVRFGDKVKIWVFRAPDGREIKFEDGSGHVVPGQLFLLASEKFFSSFDTSVFAKSEEIDLEEIIDGLATDISADPSQSEIGAAFIRIGGEHLGNIEQVEEEKKDEKELVEVPVEEPIAPQVDRQQSVEDNVVAKPRFKNPLPHVLRFLLDEAGRLGHGDVKAIFRLRRNIIFLVLVILFILMFSGFNSIRTQNSSKKLVEFRAHMATATSKYSEGVSIIELNKARARNILIEADNEVKVALSLIPKDSDALSLSSQIAQKLKETENLSNVTLTNFYSDKSNVVGLSPYGAGYVVFYTDGAVEIDKNGKKVKEYAASNVTSGATYDKSIFAFDGNKVKKLGDKDQEVAGVDGAADLQVFLGNIYLLASNQIYKFVPVEGGYTKSADYLLENETFGAQSRFAIDGSVWVTRGNEILKYTRGRRDDFALQGLTGGAGNFGEIYTNADLDNLYVVDLVNSALLVMGKDGVYSKSYQASEFSKITSLVVDETGGKMYVVSGGKVLVASL
ncbi:MAG: hypothetical protein AAB512_05265 [Patescibacteria group bacterium]